MRTKVNANFTYLYLIEIDHLYQGCGVHQNRAPHRCSTPVQRKNFWMHRCKHRCNRENPPCTGVLAPEFFCTTPAHRCIRVKCGAHRCSCTGIFQHRTSSPVQYRKIWCTPVLALEQHRCAPVHINKITKPFHLKFLI